MAAGDITAQLQRASQFNGAFFDGVDDHIEMSSVLLGSNTQAISFWFYPKVTGSQQLLVGYRNGTTTSNPSITFESTNIIKCEISGTTNSGRISGDAVLALNTWHHVVVNLIRNSNPVTVATTNIEIYTDNTLNGLTLAGTGAANLNYSNIIIGEAGNNSLDFTGCIRDLKIFNKNLSSTDVTSLYNGTFNDRSELVGEWKLCCNANDSSAFSNNGTVTGAIFTNTLSNKIKADMNRMNLTTVTDKIIALPVEGRDQIVKIVKSTRAAA